MNRKIGNDTVNKINLSKPLDMATIKRINYNLMALTKGKNVMHEHEELMDWQREIMEN